jgi:hypothetical protein
MDDLNPTVAATVTAIETEFGNRWGVWLSDTEQWWAARRQALTAAQQAAGCVPYLQASDPDALRHQIADEEALTPGQCAERAAMTSSPRDTGKETELVDKEDETVWGYLQHHWDTAYEFEYDKTPGTAKPFRVRRKDDQAKTLEAETPDELDTLIAEDYQLKPVSREVAP